eukprot:PhF_6_TR12133/c0_g1_i1/m.19342
MNTLRSVFSQTVSYLLETFFEVTEKDINLSIWNGDVKLSNLCVRSHVVNLFLQGNEVFQRCTIQSLEIQLPWSFRRQSGTGVVGYGFRMAAPKVCVKGVHVWCDLPSLGNERKMDGGGDNEIVDIAAKSDALNELEKNIVSLSR